jgi:N-acetylmuramoyl-L-alanine amidase
LNEPAALRPGSSGEAVRDLQQRLGALGHDVPRDEFGNFGPATEGALRSFQERRDLQVDGVCGPQTWNALVESGFRLGDRMLYLRRPMLKGDDVAELQGQLNLLGFDAGKEDGIFGPATGRALMEFQRNSGLGVDGILGPDTVGALARIQGPRGGSPAESSVAHVREREELRRGPHGLSGRRIFVAVAPELSALGDRIMRELVDAGALVVLDASGTDDSSLASAANRYDADLFVALRLGATGGCRCSYFASGRFRSEAGFRVATAVSAELAGVLAVEPRVCGSLHTALRETRMAAVLCEPVARDDVVGAGHVVTAGGDVARAVVAGIRRGVEEPDDLS